MAGGRKTRARSNSKESKSNNTSSNSDSKPKSTPKSETNNNKRETTNGTPRSTRASRRNSTQVEKLLESSSKSTRSPSNSTRRKSEKQQVPSESPTRKQPRLEKPQLTNGNHATECPVPSGTSNQPSNKRVKRSNSLNMSAGAKTMCMDTGDGSIGSPKIAELTNRVNKLSMDQTDNKQVGVQRYYEVKTQNLALEVNEKGNNVRRLQAQRNELNAKVRATREELQLLQEQASYVGEVVKPLDKKKVLIKINPEGKFIVDIDKEIKIEMHHWN